MKHIMIYSFYFLFFSGILSLLHAAEHSSLSLNEAVSESLQHNFSYASREIESAFPETRLEIARSDFRWNLNSGLEAERSSENEGALLTRIRADKKFSPGTVFEMRAQWRTADSGENGGQADFRLEQPLFQSFGKLASYQYVDEAQFQLEISRLRFQRETESLILRVVSSFISVLKQKESLRQETAALVRAANLVRLVEVKERQGHATGVDVLDMKMLHHQAELRYRQAEERLELTRAELAELMGRVSDQLPDLEPLSEEEFAVPPLNEAVKLARENRVERMQALLNYENARRHLRLEEREQYPDVRLIGTWQPVNESDETAWFAGVRAGRSLDLHLVRLQIEQQENQVQAALMEIAATELQIHREVLQARNRLLTLNHEQKIAGTQLSLSRERLRLAKGLYPSGRTTSVQLRDAEEEWVNAQADKTDVILQQVLARYQFWYALGLLLGNPGTPDP